MSARKALTVTFLDVGQGDATIVTPPVGEGDPVVFDCRDGWVVRQQLLTWKVERLEAVIASHLDLDHIGGMGDLLNEYRGRIGQVYWAWDRPIDDDSDGAKAAKELTDLTKEGTARGDWEMVPVHRDRRPIAAAADWAIDLLAPAGDLLADRARSGGWEDANRYSAVLRVRMGNTSLLIGGDAPLATWSGMPSDELRARIFRIPHHGGALHDGGVPEGWTPHRLYDAVAPEVAVVSVGTNNAHGHPAFDKWAQPLVKREGCRLLCTQVTGHCHKALEKPSSEAGPEEAARLKAVESLRKQWIPDPGNGVSHFTEIPWRHLRHDAPTRRRPGRVEVPCGGTITVRIEANGNVFVDPAEDHVSLNARIGGWTRPKCR